VWGAHGQRAQDDGVDEGENRRYGAETAGKRQQRGRGQPGTPSELA
jgi:hypothetical protein